MPISQYNTEFIVGANPSVRPLLKHMHGFLSQNVGQVFVPLSKDHHVPVLCACGMNTCRSVANSPYKSIVAFFCQIKIYLHMHG